MGKKNDAIDAFLNFNVKLETILEKDEKEEKDMCKALDDLYNDGVEKGRLEGKLEGIRGMIVWLKRRNFTNFSKLAKTKLMRLYLQQYS